MIVYLTLTVVVLVMGIFIHNVEYVNIPFEGDRIGKRENIRLTKSRHKSYAGNRQQMLNIVLAAAVFCLLAGVSACRIAVGNDYWVYRDNFRILMQGRYVSYEWGFNLVVWVIQSLFGYDAYLPVFGFFSIVTAFFFVKALYQQAEWFAASLFLLLANGYYFNSMNSIRYYFALAIALFAMRHVIRREYGKFILWIVLAACFHKSVLVVIPIYIAARWLAERKINKIFYIAGGVLWASLFVFQDFFRQILFMFYPYYENSQFDTGDISVTNIIKCIGTLILCVIFYNDGLRESVRNRFYFFLNLAGLIVYTCGSFIPEVSRIGFYLTVSQIFLVPGVLIRIRNKKARWFFTVAAAAVFIAYFALYLRSAADTSVRVLPYRSWIFD